jgi:hypothetical protein
MRSILMNSACLGFGAMNDAPHAAAPTGGGPMSVNANVSGSVTAYRGDPLSDPGKYKVNVPKTLEYINQPLYSYQLYPAAGAVTLSFFQSPAGGTVTREFTNMELAAQLPSPQMFLIQGIGIDYLPGTTTGLPVLGPRADANTGALNDFYTIMRAGVLTLSIGSKQYFQMAPMLALPPRAHMDGVAAAATNLTIGAATQTIMQIGFSTGPVFKPVPLLLESSQNFNVSINFPGGAIATPSTDALAKIGVILYGTLYRPAQ